MEGAPPSPEGHLFSSTVMDTPAHHVSGTNHTLSSTTDHRTSPGFRGPSLAQWLWVWDGFHTYTHQGGVSTCDFCAQNPHWDHTCHGSKHTPPPWTQPLCSAEQLLPPGNQGQSSCSSQWRTNWGRRKWWGAPEGGGNILRSRPQESLSWPPQGLDHWLRCSQMAPCWLSLSSQHHWLWRTHHLLSRPVEHRPSPHWFTCQTQALAHRQSWGPREGLVSDSEKTVFPSVSLAEKPSLENLNHPNVYSLKNLEFILILETEYYDEIWTSCEYHVVTASKFVQLNLF